MEINRLNNPHKKNNDQQIEEDRQKKAVAKLWSQWRSNLTSRSRTRDEVVASLEELSAKLERIGNTHLVLAAVAMVNDHIARTIALNILLKNSIRQHITRKGFLRNNKAKPKHEPFATYEELMALPWVKLFTELPQFKRFALIGHGLVAVHGDNEIELVGYVENEIGLGDITDYVHTGSKMDGAASDDTDSTSPSLN